MGQSRGCTSARLLFSDSCYLLNDFPPRVPMPVKSLMQHTRATLVYACTGNACGPASRLPLVATTFMSRVLRFLSDYRRVANASYGHRSGKVSARPRFMLHRNFVAISGVIGDSAQQAKRRIVLLHFGCGPYISPLMFSRRLCRLKPCTS